MPSYIGLLVTALLVWRLSGFVSAYRRARSAAAEKDAEREQKQDWAERMQGRSEKRK